MRYVIVLFASLVFSACEKNSDVDISSINLIPESTSIIVKVNDFASAYKTIPQTDLTQRFSETEAYGFVKTNGLESVARSFKGEVVICLVPLGKNEYELFSFGEVNSKLDTTTFSKARSKTYLDHKIKSYSENDKQFHTVRIGKNRFVSSSQLLLENCIRNQNNPQLTPENQALSKIWGTADSGVAANLFINGKNLNALGRNLIPKLWSSPLPVDFDWIALDLNVKNIGLLATGILTMEGNSSALGILSNTEPVRLRTLDLIPPQTTSATVVGFKDWQAYAKGLSEYRQIMSKDLTVQRQELLTNIQEITCLSLASEKIVIIRPLDEDIVQDALPQEAPVSVFRETDIYKMQDSLFARQAFKELLDPPALNYYAQLEGCLIFGKGQNEIKSVITSIKNQTHLGNNGMFKEFSESLSRNASYMYLAFNENLKKSALSKNPDLTASTISTEDYPFTSIQLIGDNGFFHTNLLLKKNEVKENEGAVAQMASIPLANNLLVSPQLVKNHLTQGQDILVQDVDNTLYLIDNSGKVLWKKELPNPILGEVQQVDIYKNGRLQLAFATRDKLYVLDRNGEEVAPYPLSLTKQITQPLAVFDYDNSRNYRLITVHGNEVQMRNVEGKIVTGFNFTKADSPIVFPAKHIRIGKKDYILIAEADGSLNILNRVGKIRIPLKDTFNWGETGIFEHKSNFVFHTADGVQVQVSQSGRIKKLEQPDALIKYDYANKTKALLKDNTLTINGNTVELNFGLYTRPVVQTVGKKNIITLYDDQAHLIYAFDEKGELLSNFPVYGSSPAEFGHLEEGRQMGFVTQGEANTVLIYHITD